MKITTTTDLKALRLMLGLEPAKAGEMLGKDAKWVEDAERARRWHIDPDYAEMLLGIDAQVQCLMDDIIGSTDAFVLVYSRDEVFRQFEPNWAFRLPSARAHLTGVARAKLAIDAGETTRTAPVSIVTMAPQAFAEFLDHNRRSDSPEERQRWADAFARNYRVAGDEEPAPDHTRPTPALRRVK